MDKKKVLLVDNNFYNYGSAIEYYLQLKGLEVQRLCIEIPLDLKARIYNWIVKKIKIFFRLDKEFRLLKSQIRKISNEILQKYSAYEPDCVLFIKADYISKEALMHMQQAQLVVWMMDSYARYPFLKKDLGLFHNIFVFEKRDTNLLKEEGIESYFLPLCADERFFYPQVKHKDIDILFIGAMYNDRLELLKKIIARFPEANIEIYGYYINRFEFIKKIIYKWTNKYRNFHGRVTPQEANDLYSRSKICINIHNCQSKSGANPRTFEILATKSFEIVDYNPYIEEILAGGVCLYRSEREMFQKIEYYLEHDSERDNIAEKGYVLTKRKHMFSQRIDELIEKCGWE